MRGKVDVRRHKDIKDGRGPTAALAADRRRLKARCVGGTVGAPDASRRGQRSRDGDAAQPNCRRPRQAHADGASLKAQHRLAEPSSPDGL